MGKATRGSFYANGRRKQPTTKAEREDKSRILPTPETIGRVNSRKAYWTHPDLLNGKAGDDCFDNAGVLCISGWFTGHGFQPEVIRDALRLYACLYHEWYIATAPKIAQPERVSRANLPTEKTKREALFQKLDGRLRMGSAERKAVHQACIDGWFFDALDPRAERLANTGRLLLNERLKLDPKLPVAGYLERPGDREWLEDLLRGSFELIDANLPQRRNYDIAFWKFSEAA